MTAPAGTVSGDGAASGQAPGGALGQAPGGASGQATAASSQAPAAARAASDVAAAGPPKVATIDWSDYQALIQLYSNYASAVDSNDWDLWPGFFTEDCVYRIVPRENDERGWPLATLGFDNRRMLLDRVYGIKETLFHDPYYQRHVVGAPVVRSVGANGIRSEANYAVFRTKLSEPSVVFNVGRYRDLVVRTEVGLKFRERVCVYDTELIPNSIIYPI